MRRLQTIGFGLVMSLAAVGTARAGVLEHQTLKGKAADLEFLISTPETCADGSEGSSDESVSLFGEESLITSHVSGRTLINALSAIVVFSDSCTGSVTILVGQVEGGFNSLTPRRASVRHRLAPASTTTPPIDAKNPMIHAENDRIRLLGQVAMNRPL